jgi:hypothetical protein
MTLPVENFGVSFAEGKLFFLLQNNGEFRRCSVVLTANFAVVHGTTANFAVVPLFIPENYMIWL